MLFTSNSVYKYCMPYPQRYRTVLISLHFLDFFGVWPFLQFRFSVVLFYLLICSSHPLEPHPNLFRHRTSNIFDIYKMYIILSVHCTYKITVSRGRLVSWSTEVIGDKLSAQFTLRPRPILGGSPLLPSFGLMVVHVQPGGQALTHEITHKLTTTT